jgi:spore protease
MMNFRTDLALERRDIYRKANNISNEVDGIKTEEEQLNENLRITRVKVLNENGEQAIRKKKRKLYYNRY